MKQGISSVYIPLEDGKYSNAADMTWEEILEIKMANQGAFTWQELARLFHADLQSIAASGLIRRKESAKQKRS